MSNLFKKNIRQQVDYYENKRNVSPVRLNSNRSRSPFRTSNNFHQNNYQTYQTSRYQPQFYPEEEQFEIQYDSFVKINPARPRTPVRNATSPIRRTVTPKQQCKSPLRRMRTPIKNSKREVVIEYANEDNGFGRNPQSIKNGYANNALINTHQKRNQMFSQLGSTYREKENQTYIPGYSNNNYRSNINMEAQFSKKKFVKNGISFKTALSRQQSDYTESVNHTERNFDFESGLSVKSNSRSNYDSQLGGTNKNVPLIAQNLSPMANVRKNLNSHRETEVKPKFHRRMSDFPCEGGQSPLKYYSTYQGDAEFDQSPSKSPYGNPGSPTAYRSGMQSPNNQGASITNSTIKKSVKQVSLFTENLSSKELANEPKSSFTALLSKNRDKENTQRGMNHASNDKMMKKNAEKAAQIEIQPIQSIKEEPVPLVQDSIQIILKKAMQKPEIQEQEKSIEHNSSVVRSSGFNEESLNMDACL